jgi:hypothetical protein
MACPYFGQGLKRLVQNTFEDFFLRIAFQAPNISLHPLKLQMCNSCYQLDEE